MKLNEITERKAGDLDEVQYYKSNGYLNLSSKYLTSLEGCPEKVDGYFACTNNLLTSLEGCPKYIDGRCYINNNNFTSFKDIDQHIKFIRQELDARGLNITSGFSDLFGIDGLTEIWIDNIKMQKIVNKYIKKKDIIEFQDEMIKAGYESYL